MGQYLFLACLLQCLPYAVTLIQPDWCEAPVLTAPAQQFDRCTSPCIPHTCPSVPLGPALFHVHNLCALQHPSTCPLPLPPGLARTCVTTPSSTPSPNSLCAASPHSYCVTTPRSVLGAACLLFTRYLQTCRSYSSRARLAYTDTSTSANLEGLKPIPGTRKLIGLTAARSVSRMQATG
jgi:hypothetical protein